VAWISEVHLAQILRLPRLLRRLLLLVLLLLLLLLLRLARLLWLLRMARLMRLWGALHLLLLWLLTMLELLLPLVLRLWLRRGRPWLLIRGNRGRTSSACLGVCPLARDWSVSFRGIGLRRRGHWVRTGFTPFRRGHLGLGGSPSLRVGSHTCAAMETFLPATALALMVLVIKILVIMLTHMVVAPIGVSLGKSLHILRVLMIPGGPPRGVPVSCSDNVGSGISVIWSPPILRAKKIVQQSIIKPITLIKDPGGVGPNPRYPIRILGRWERPVGASIIWAGWRQADIWPRASNYSQCAYQQN
jgi:hypothetical protein